MFKNIIAYTKELFSSKAQSLPSHYVKTPRVIQRDEHGIDRRLVSLEAMRTVKNLQRAGFEAYVVGGAVRDLLLGVTPKDFDVVTDATPEEVKRCQKRAIIIGKRFRLVHVMFGREKIECSTFRAYSRKPQREIVLKPSRLPKLARSTVNGAPVNSVATAVPRRKAPSTPLISRNQL